MMASCKSPYEPREDSTLLERYVREQAYGDVLDMGTGSGIQAIAAAQSSKVKSVLATDIQKTVIGYCRKCIKHKKIQFLVSDLFKNIQNIKEIKAKKIKTWKFDTIIFNPPYLPDELKVRDLTLEGGKKGYEAIEMFLSEVNGFLKPDGIILIVFSSLTKKEKVDEFIRNNLLEYELLEKQHYFFEDLYVYKIKKSGILNELDKHNVKNIKYFAKGKRGFVFTASCRGGKIAVKINNPESKAAMRMENEAKFLKLLNKKGIGPKLLFQGDDFLAYKFAEGGSIMEFLSISAFKKSPIKKTNKDSNNKNNNKTVINNKAIIKNKKIIINTIKKIMKQLYEMDKLKIEKREMSHPQKHIIIDKKNNPTLIDFERCRYKLNPGNVTQFCDFLTSGHVSSILSGENITIKKDALIDAARLYKKNQNNLNYKQIIKIIENG